MATPHLVLVTHNFPFDFIGQIESVQNSEVNENYCESFLSTIHTHYIYFIKVSEGRQVSGERDSPPSTIIMSIRVPKWHVPSYPIHTYISLPIHLRFPCKNIPKRRESEINLIRERRFVHIPRPRRDFIDSPPKDTDAYFRLNLLHDI